MIWKIEKLLACRHRRVLRGHEEDSASESEIEASIIDSNGVPVHRRHHMHAKSDESKTGEAAAAGSAPAAAGGDAEMKEGDDEKKAGSAAPAAAAAAAAPPQAWKSSRRAGVSDHSGGDGGAKYVSDRPRPAVDDPNYTSITEYLVKIEGQSYLHTEWHSVESLKRKFGNPSRINQRVTTFHSTQAETEAQNLDRYGGAPFDPRFIEVDRIIASNMVDVEEEEEEKAAREKKNRAEYEAWAVQMQARQAEINALAQTDQAAAMQLSMRNMLQPLVQPVPVQAPKVSASSSHLIRCVRDTTSHLDLTPLCSCSRSVLLPS